MSELIQKLSSYNLFNYLFPGTVFAHLAERFTAYQLLQEDLFVAFFVYYFAGLVISRVGSLLIEPVLKKVGFVKFASYEDFVRREKEDQKLEVLSEANNTYRTLTSLFLSLGVLKGAETLLALEAVPVQAGPVVLTLGLSALFLFSYRKQTEYIRKRVNAATDGGS